MTGPRSITIRRLTTAVGALIEGVDLCRPLDAETVRRLRQALLDHGVVFFRKQPFDTARMRTFASCFGTPMPEPFVNTEIEDKDPVTEGNLVATRYATAVWHSDTSYVPEPPMLTALRAVKLPPVGGDTWFEHVKSPDFSMRWRWEPDDVALWDNRSVQHYAVPDYETERVMQRVVLVGDRPYGPGEASMKPALQSGRSRILA